MTASCNARSETAASSNSTRALWVPKLTLAARTPARRLSTRSLRAAQDARCMPPMLNVAVFMISFRPPLFDGVDRRRRAVLADGVDREGRDLRAGHAG